MSEYVSNIIVQHAGSMQRILGMPSRSRVKQHTCILPTCMTSTTNSLAMPQTTNTDKKMKDNHSFACSIWTFQQSRLPLLSALSGRLFVCVSVRLSDSQFQKFLKPHTYFAPTTALDARYRHADWIPMSFTILFQCDERICLTNALNIPGFWGKYQSTG